MDLYHFAVAVGDMFSKQLNIQAMATGRQTQLIATQVPTSSHVFQQMFGGKQLKELILIKGNFSSAILLMLKDMWRGLHI